MMFLVLVQKHGLYFCLNAFVMQSR